MNISSAVITAISSAVHFQSAFTHSKLTLTCTHLIIKMTVYVMLQLWFHVVLVWVEHILANSIQICYLHTHIHSSIIHIACTLHKHNVTTYIRFHFHLTSQLFP